VETKVRNLSIRAQVTSMLLVSVVAVSLFAWAIYLYREPAHIAKIECEQDGWTWLKHEEKCIMIKEIK
jgi:hypothetical protein